MCPRESLMAFRPSMSIITRPKRPRWRATRPSSRPSSISKARRFSRPVRGSTNASRSSWANAPRAAHAIARSSVVCRRDQVSATSDRGTRPRRRRLTASRRHTSSSMAHGPARSVNAATAAASPSSGPHASGWGRPRATASAAITGSGTGGSVWGGSSGSQRHSSRQSSARRSASRATNAAAAAISPETGGPAGLTSPASITTPYLPTGPGAQQDPRHRRPAFDPPERITPYGPHGPVVPAGWSPPRHNEA